MKAGFRFRDVSTLTLIITRFVFLPLIASGYLFDSIAHLQSLVDLESDLGEKLRAYVTGQQDDSVDKVQHFAKLVENMTSLAKAQGPSFIDNPINAYSIIKRFTEDWSKLDLILKKDDKQNDLIDTINSTKASFSLDDSKDLIGASAAIFRLQSTYNISARAMIEGKIPGCQATLPMTVEDCYELGKVAYDGYQFTRSREWLEEAVRLVRKGHSEGRATFKRILEYLAWVEYLTGDIEKALTLTWELLELAPKEQKLRDNERYYRQLLEYDLPLSQDQIEAREESTNTQAYINSPYARICRGETIKPFEHQNDLKCWWHHGDRRSALLFKPAKLELINVKPRIFIFRGIVSDLEAESIKNLAAPMLKRATVYNLEKRTLDTAEYRVSKSAWLSESSHDVVARVNRRVSLVTGLDQHNAEGLQVANYGIGGQYEEHVDFGDPDSPIAIDPRGNRVATLLIYLNNVTSGGGTAFIDAGLNILPIKGDAVFWYNLKRSGEGDNTTLHAGCPVLCGNKWIANKWFREGGQNIFNRPCALNKNL